ncbi:MAG: thymidine phosphorylase [Spirochaetales bacterium]
MRAVELIMDKRSGVELNEAQIRFLVQGYTKGEIPDYQMSAWLMAVFFRGMTFRETGYLTRAMIDSGEVLPLEGIAGPLVDKHSTGGVGDKISLMLAPLAAACGLRVPMMSGRALGHTGGTLDKLDAIPGFSTRLNNEQIRRALLEVGYFMTGQSEAVVPADRLMYGLRDVTATVESVPLITASILSKKFAEGAQALLFDVKSGRGAFMKTTEEAQNLAESLVKTAQSLGRKAVALLTNMEQPLGRMTGNFLEVEEAVLFLRGEGYGGKPADDLMSLTLRQVAWMLVAGGLVKSVEEGERLAKARLDDGSALKLWEKNVAFQGGDVAALNAQLGKRRAKFHAELRADQNGYHGGWDALTCGLAATALGAGRSTKADLVLPDVGLEFHKKQGDSVKNGEILLTVWADSEAKRDETLSRLSQAWSIVPQPPVAAPLLMGEVTAL